VLLAKADAAALKMDNSTMTSTDDAPRPRWEVEEDKAAKKNPWHFPYVLDPTELTSYEDDAPEWLMRAEKAAEEANAWGMCSTIRWFSKIVLKTAAENVAKYPALAEAARRQAAYKVAAAKKKDKVTSTDDAPHPSWLVEEDKAAENTLWCYPYVLVLTELTSDEDDAPEWLMKAEEAAEEANTWGMCSTIRWFSKIVLKTAAENVAKYPALAEAARRQAAYKAAEARVKEAE
jgi:hypothetical protein